MYLSGCSGHGSRISPLRLQVMLRAGGHSIPATLLLQDSQLTQDRCWEDLAQFLTHGEVPNLLGLEDRNAVLPSPATHAISTQWRAGETVCQRGLVSKT